MVRMRRLPSGRGQRGFTLIEILVGLSVLGMACISLSAYTASQRKGLYKSSQLSDATQAAASALETLKGQMADSAAFKKMYDNAAGRTVTQSGQKTVNKRVYAVDLAISRAPAPLYALKVRAKASWAENHKVTLGLLYPGASANL
jgi:prepilin-type N-terminal cleavage/methylation domain-containing protein